jgi:hypothetical protein
MSNFADGYPKTIYDDGYTKLQVWKLKGSEYSQLTLLIANGLFSVGEVGAVNVMMNGDEYVCLKPPRKMSSQIKNALHDERFETEGEDDIKRDSEFLVIRLGDTLANDIGRLFDENNVIYNEAQFIQFQKDRCAEEDKFKKAYYAATATRPIHPNIAILQTKLDELDASIEAVEVNDDNENSYDEAVETLRAGVDNCLEEIEHFQQEIPDSGGTEAEENAVLEIERKIKELDQKRRRKLDDIGYENPEDSRSDLFPNGEDED